MFLSGMFAGACYTNVAFGFDLLKVRLQSVRSGRMTYGETIQDIYSKEGLAGFTRGYQGMLLRDVPGFGVYFCTFAFMKR